jgi:hypothetical protein
MDPGSASADAASGSASADVISASGQSSPPKETKNLEDWLDNFLAE